MDVTITPRVLKGSVAPPSSKSMAHRLLICAALAEGESTLQNLADSQDLQATRRCMEALGARFVPRPDGALQIRGVGWQRERGALPELDCGESGSTLRFLIPVALALAGGGQFTGHGRLMDRPQGPYFDLFAEKGIFYERSGDVLTVRGTLTPGEYRLPGDVSSQFFTGLLLALPLLDKPSSIVATTAVESADYLLMTLDALHEAGVAAEAPVGDDGMFRTVPSVYRPFSAEVEADWSQAAFWYAAAFLDNAVTLADGALKPDSVQGDRVISELYWRLARPGADVEIDLSGCPDLLPPLAVMAAVRSGQTRFTHGARLRMKESDRLATTAAMIRALGGSVAEQPEGLAVRGKNALAGGAVDGAGDHRIVMAAAIAATACTGPVTILGAEAVNKSYPSFWDEYRRLGGLADVQ